MCFNITSYQKLHILVNEEDIKEKLTEREEQSVIAHLLRYDEMIKKLFDEIRNAQGVSSEVQMFSDDINDKIKDAFEDIRKEMTNKLQNILFFIEEKKIQ